LDFFSSSPIHFGYYWIACGYLLPYPNISKATNVSNFGCSKSTTTSRAHDDYFRHRQNVIEVRGATAFAKRWLA
jgi:hypothetical protein